MQPGRIRDAAVAAALTLAAAPALAHGDHGPGGHDRWDLDHLAFAGWGALDWGIAAALLLAAVAGAAAFAVARGSRRRRRKPN
jgi:hypothetical protein